MRIQYTYFLLTIFILSALLSCSTNEDKIETETKEERITIYFNSVGPTTYALDFEKESKVETIDMLAFKSDGSGAYYAYGRQIDEDEMGAPVMDEATGLYKRSFEVMLENDGSQYVYVFLANARNEVSTCLSTYPAVIEKESLLSHIVSSNIGVWNTGSSYKRIPMWGEYGPSLPTALNGKTVGMARAVARVDISVSAANFTLSGVCLKNQYNHGRVVPVTAYWNTADKKVTAPSIPLSSDYSGQLINTSPLLYAPAAATGGVLSGNQVVRSIYLFETELPQDNNYINTTHLIIKGALAGYAESYYRADFKDFFTNSAENNENSWEDGPPTTSNGSGGFVGSGEPYRKLLRNHHYQMNIISVAGEGYSTIDLASANLHSQRMLSEYINWNDQSNQVDVGNTSYSFDVSRAKILFNSAFTQDFIIVQTNYPGEWEVEVPGAASWFTCLKRDGGVEVTFTGDSTSTYSGEFNIVLKKDGQVKFTKKIQVQYGN